MILSIAHKTDLRSILAALILSALVLTGCATRQPENVDNICEIFQDKRGWYRHAKRAESNWGTPVYVSMAIMRQESTFVSNARPPRRKLLGFIPWRRPSTAYGYAQVKNETWDWYRERAGNPGARRRNFADAIDFVAWYGHITAQINNVPRTDARRLYLNYHEGHGGYQRGSYRSKGWLQDVAQRVETNANTYQRQLEQCEHRLRRPLWRRLIPFV